MKIRLYHNWLFLFGFIYYLIVPLVVVYSRIWEDYPGMHNLYIYYSEKYILGYLLLVCIIGFSFFVGSLIPYKKHIKVKIIKQHIILSKHLFIISSPLIIICEFIIFKNRSYLFQGYLAEIDSPFVGTIATTSIFTLFTFFYNRMGLFSKSIDKILVIILLELSVVMLGLGTRMYTILPLISFIIYLLDNHKTSIRKISVYSIGTVLLILMVGIWRLGSSEINLDGILYIGIAEPTFTWISAISMYDINKLPLLLFPSQFLSSYINFLPSLLFPMKGEWIANLPLDYETPLGACSILVSLISNFGLLGSFFAIFCLGYLLTLVRLRWRTVFGRSYYYCICGIIPFQLFRDSVVIVNKEIFFSMLILPCLFFIISKKKTVLLPN